MAQHSIISPAKSLLRYDLIHDIISLCALILFMLSLHIGYALAPLVEFRNIGQIVIEKQHGHQRYLRL